MRNSAPQGFWLNSTKWRYLLLTVRNNHEQNHIKLEIDYAFPPFRNLQFLTISNWRQNCATRVKLSRLSLSRSPSRPRTLLKTGRKRIYKKKVTYTCVARVSFLAYRSNRGRSHNLIDSQLSIKSHRTTHTSRAAIEMRRSHTQVRILYNIQQSHHTTRTRPHHVERTFL